MKMILTVGTMIATLLVTHGQDIEFANYLLGMVDAPVFDQDCSTGLTGPRYVAQLFVGLDPTSLSTTATLSWRASG